jgi:hypothetical protein
MTLRVIVVLALADIVVFALTIRSHLNYHRPASGPSVMPLGQLVGWIVGFGLLLVLAAIVFATAQAARYRRTGRI